MKRRSFLGKAALGTAALASGCGGQAGSEAGSAAIHTLPRVRWRLASSFPRSLDTIFGAAETLSSRLDALTEGRFTIRVYPAGELVPYDQVLDAVQRGTVPCAHTASYYFIGKNPALAFDTCVPFGLSARQQNAWLYHLGGLDLLRELFADFNVLNFPGGNTGTQMGGWFRREISSISDLQGLKMRIPGLGGRVMDRLGVTVQLLAGGEIYQALERGTIDAAEWVGPYDDEKLSFHKVARYYYYPGWWEPGPTLSFYVNRDEWARLPAVYREAFTTAAAEANIDMLASYDAKNPAALARLMQGGTETRAFSREILQAAQRESFGVFEELAATDAGYRKVYSAWTEARAGLYAWFGTAERTFADFAFPG